MPQKYFLKLDGVEGESKSPRHLGEIDIFAFSWGGKHQGASGSGGGPGKASISDLYVAKKADKASPILSVACESGQYFAKALLTVEEISEQGSMIRSTIAEMKSLNIESVTRSEDEETVTFNFQDLKIKQS